MRLNLTLGLLATAALLGTAFLENGAANAQDSGTLSPLTDIADRNISRTVEFCPDGLTPIIDDDTQCPRPDSLLSLIEDYESFTLQIDPVRAGLEGNASALRRLPDVSQVSLDLKAQRTAEFLGRHARLPKQTMSKPERLNYDLLGFALRQEQRLIPFDEARIPFTNDNGFFNVIDYISRQTQFQTTSDYEAYAARLTQLPRFFSQHKDNMRRGIKTNFTANAQTLPGIMDTIKAYAKGQPTSHALYKPFTQFPNSIPLDTQARLQGLGKAAIKSAVIPAYKNLNAFFEDEYLPSARAQAGIGTTEEGRAYYRALVRYFTTLDIKPDAVHALGISEVARIRKQMDLIIEEVGFDGSFAEFLEFLRTDEQFYAKTKEELLLRAAWIAKQIDGQMPSYFGTLPRLSYGIMAAPESIEKTYTTGRYWGGNPDTGRAANYIINTYDLNQRPLYNLPALTAHESVPGHHQQIALSQELKDLPRFRQNLYPNAFGEGWGLYAEKLAGEMGIYKTPYERFGQLTYEMWRACRLIVDTGLHWKGWSREQAEACFFENSALSTRNIKTEVERYMSWPGQALSYKIGELKILELRKRTQDALGQNFDIRKFHDAVLANGGVPLDILEREIEIFIFDQRRLAQGRSGGNLRPMSGQPR